MTTRRRNETSASLVGQAHRERRNGLRRWPAGLSVSLEGTNLTREQRYDGVGLPLPAQALWLARVRWSFGR